MIGRMARRVFTSVLPIRRPGEITLVVDDGPSGATPELLSLLEGGGHRAVLFVLGCNVVGREAIAVDAVRRGFALGNHSYLHPDFSHIGLQEARSEIERTEALIEDVYARAGVQRPGKWFRFPFLSEGGDRRAALQAMLRELGFAQPDAVARRLDEQERARIDWPTTVGTHDWELPPENVFRMLVASTCPGDVVEFHDWPDTVARYGQRLVEGLSKLSLRATVPGALTPAATSANMAPEVWVTTQPGRRRR